MTFWHRFPLRLFALLVRDKLEVYLEPHVMSTSPKTERYCPRGQHPVDDERTALLPKHAGMSYAATAHVANEPNNREKCPDEDQYQEGVCMKYILPSMMFWSALLTLIWMAVEVSFILTLLMNPQCGCESNLIMVDGDAY